MPRLDFWFRLFHHASLGLASVCLLYAEAFFLPTPLLIGLYLMAGMQVLAFGADGQRWVLPSWAANLLAGAVAGGGSTWIVVELRSPDSVLADLPLPAGLLPYIGPILIGLLVVKLFRPRTPRDFWLLQGVGALQVALASVLATNPDSGLLFGLLLAAYMAFALGCLALHYFQEGQKDKSGVSFGGAPQTGSAAGRLPFAYRMAPFCLRWTLAVVALAAPLFLVTPRLNGPSWDSLTVSGSAVRTDAAGGAAGFSMTIDLNRAGTVRLTGEEAFRVVVVAAPGEPAPEIPADQHWRGAVLDTYSIGSWSNEASRRSSAVPTPRPPSPAPPLGPGRRRLDFTVAQNAHGFFLAEPVRVAGDPDRLTWAEAGSLENPLPLRVSTRGPVLPLMPNGRHEYRYRQTISTEAGLEPSTVDYDDDYRNPSNQVKMRGLSEWTAGLLKRLADEPAYGLTPADVRLVADPPGTPAALPRGAWERVGRALANYLARSGDYSYSLDLRRHDPTLDPVMDFLVNVKQGHCERFASALTLMLRSQGVPSRIVVGFRGAGERGDGYYVIRQNQAHAWVEMQKPGEPPPDMPAGARKTPRTVEWLSLDPTPGVEAPPPTPYTLWAWLEDGQRTGQELWGGMVVNYSADQQADLWATLQSPRATATLTGAALMLPFLAALGGLTWVGLRWRRGVRREAARTAVSAAAGYTRLLALLARHGNLRPRIGQTPREFAAQARFFLLSLPAIAQFADLPDAIVDRLYRVRFGGQALTDEENAAVAPRLDQLTAALRAAR
jgi:protein-glutamine gamma-glutamyltransferase